MKTFFLSTWANNTTKLPFMETGLLKVDLLNLLTDGQAHRWSDKPGKLNGNFDLGSARNVSRLEYYLLIIQIYTKATFHSNHITSFANRLLNDVKLH